MSDADQESDVTVEDVREAMSVAPKEMRAQLQRDLSENYTKMRATLESAMSAETERSVRCVGCGRKNPVSIADTRARLEAIRLFHELGFGKPQPQGEDEPVEIPPDITKLSRDEREVLRRRLYKLARPEVRRAIYGDEAA